MRARTWALAALITAGIMLAGCNGDARTSSSSTDADTSKATSSPTESTDTGDDQREQFPIEITEPATFSSVHGSFRLAGTATVFEGTLAWQILDEQLKPMKHGTMTASCGGPCRGTFSTTIDLAGVKPGSWELHVFAPPVADDDPPRVHDTILPITVTTAPVGDQPAADAPPPGGTPTP